MKRYAMYLALLLLVIFIGIQFVPVRRTNRLGAGDPSAPRNVQWILRRTCYDCHSTETRWPVWAYVAPMSWKVVDDVNRARLFLNFSDLGVVRSASAACDADERRPRSVDAPNAVVVLPHASPRCPPEPDGSPGVDGVGERRSNRRGLSALARSSQ